MNRVTRNLCRRSQQLRFVHWTKVQLRRLTAEYAPVADGENNLTEAGNTLVPVVATGWNLTSRIKLVQSRPTIRGGDDAEKSGAGGTDSDSLNRTGPTTAPTTAMPTRMHVANSESRKGHQKLPRLEC
jgi:hypothetical protein